MELIKAVDLALYAQWFACALGASGALLLALNTKYSRYGWLFFLASNAGWILYSALIGSMGLATQQIIFCITSGIGVYQWFFKPLNKSALHSND